MNKEIKKRIVTSVLATSILLSGCGMKRKNVDVSKQSGVSQGYSQTDAIENKGQNIYYTKNNSSVDLDVLNDSNYISVGVENRYTLCSSASIFIKKGKKIVDERIADDYMIVKALESNSRYTMIELADGTIAYVDNYVLFKCANLQKSEYNVVTENKEMVTVALTNLYDNDGKYIGYVTDDVSCQAVASNDEYTLLSFENGMSAFALSSSLTIVNKQINGYAIVNNSTVIYDDKELHTIVKSVDAGSVIYVMFSNDKYAEVLIDGYSEVAFIDVKNFDKDFIIVDLDTQRMDCYLDYQLAGSWGTRTGKNSTPTHTGMFDIDWKKENWEFTKYPGCRAKYWIPINEFEEGIHDLIGDDEQNYGNQAYQLDGSHGCIRVPAEASEFVYNNYEIGEYVLVRKK